MDDLEMGKVPEVVEETRAYFPIITDTNGEEITKYCVEDVYKIINRLDSIISRHKDKIEEIYDSYYTETVDVEGDDVEGYLIIGKGTSKPCEPDIFNEDVGNHLAFVKSKLNANLKKLNLISKVSGELCKAFPELDMEYRKFGKEVIRDLEEIRKYNPDYLSDIEYDFGLYD